MRRIFLCIIIFIFAAFFYLLQPRFNLFHQSSAIACTETANPLRMSGCDNYDPCGTGTSSLYTRLLRFCYNADCSNYCTSSVIFKNLSACNSVDLSQQATNIQCVLTCNPNTAGCNTDGCSTQTTDSQGTVWTYKLNYCNTSQGVYCTGGWSDQCPSIAAKDGPGTWCDAWACGFDCNISNPYPGSCTNSVPSAIGGRGPDFQTLSSCQSSCVKPTVSITANGRTVSANVLPNSTFDIGWSSTNANSCTASGTWSGTKATSGLETKGPLSPGSYPYTLQCSNTFSSNRSVVSDPSSVTVSISNIGSTCNLNHTCDGSTCTFTSSYSVSGQSQSSYLINFHPDINNYSVQTGWERNTSVTHTYTDGTYTAQLEAKDINGGNYTTCDSGQFTIGNPGAPPPPPPGVSGQPTVSCSNFNLSITQTGCTTSICPYPWYIKNSNNIIVGQGRGIPASQTMGSSGTYYVFVNDTAALGSPVECRSDSGPSPQALGIGGNVYLYQNGPTNQIWHGEGLPAGESLAVKADYEWGGDTWSSRNNGIVSLTGQSNCQTSRIDSCAFAFTIDPSRPQHTSIPTALPRLIIPLGANLIDRTYYLPNPTYSASNTTCNAQATGVTNGNYFCDPGDNNRDCIQQGVQNRYSGRRVYYCNSQRNCSGTATDLRGDGLCTMITDYPRGFYDSLGSTASSTWILKRMYVEVPPPAAGPWWQAKDADLYANGNITSLIPSQCAANPSSCTPDLILDGLGGYPGVPVANGSVNTGRGGGTISSKNWLAEDSSYLGNYGAYNFSAIKKRMPSNSISLGPTISGGSLHDLASDSGYTWYYSPTTLTIDGVANLGARKVVLVVDGSLNIGTNSGNTAITVSPENGFFAAIVRDDININSNSVPQSNSSSPDLEGIFFAGRDINTGTNNPNLGDPVADKKLSVRGVLAALGHVRLDRDLDPQKTNNQNETNPSEVVEYAPDIIFNIPPELYREGQNWQEVAP